MPRTKVRLKDNHCKWPKCGKPIEGCRTYCDRFCHRRHMKDQGHAEQENKQRLAK